MIGCDFRAHRDQRVFGHAELRKLAARLDIGFAEIAAVGLVHVVGAARARAKLERDIAILVLGAMGNDLALQ